MDDRAIYLKQMELGPMQNFVYLVGDPVARECVVVDPAWEIDTIVETAEADGHDASPARSSPTPTRITWAGAWRLGHAGPHPGRRGAARAGPGEGLRPQGRARVPAAAWAPTWSRWTTTTRCRSGGFTMTFLHTPGHTPGSQCFLVDGRLISGDTLFIGSCGRTDLPGQRSERDVLFAHPAARARCPTTRSCFPATTTAAPSSTIGDEKRENPFMRFAALGDFLRVMGGGRIVTP